ncbi:CPBP family intramembrane metalloprotease [Paenibacillus sp. LMG 31461]|uniref:CPBP family intramembrane metalloprotease n=1 Tax=Paenibacillus plantarum TaxID=2654975 RepID=A0ABX1X8I7_9BACL|nr:CPBP family intramembrane glutamic endopeptidase [Paenibacillus plantarum]NOU64521.1 CPBP family intramembrane metalloprotease [Paenibacillus plantarum]
MPIMSDKTYKDQPVLFSLFLGIVLTLLISVASAAATVRGLGDTGMMIAQGCAFIVMAIAVTMYMRRKDSTMAIFGFKRLAGVNNKAVLYYVPLVIIVFVQPVIGGFNSELSLGKIVLIVLFSLVVGYTEESIFRGIIWAKLKDKSSLFYILFSSIFFGILHMANALNGRDWLSILLQIINAFLIGLILALLIVMTARILPLIIFHFMFDAMAQLTNATTTANEVFVVAVLSICYLLYGAYLVVMLTRRRRTNIQIAA